MNIKQQYAANKAARVGDSCRCPSCGTEFTKTNYQQAFCKTKSGTICKDRYWNTVIPSKRNNTTRISPASARWLSARHEQSMHDAALDGLEFGWDGHKNTF